MPDSDDRSPDAPVRSIAHDLRQSLHVLGIGLELLRTCRSDERQFRETWELLNSERQHAVRLLSGLLADVSSRETAPVERDDGA